MGWRYDLAHTLQLLRRDVCASYRVDGIWLPHLLQVVPTMTSGSPQTRRSSGATQNRFSCSRDGRLKSALAKWSDPDTMRGLDSKTIKSRIRFYAGVMVPGCFFKKRAGGNCYLDECGKDVCQRECEYLLEVQSILSRFKKKGISIVGCQEEALEEAFENLQVPATSQTTLSDWP